MLSQTHERIYRFWNADWFEDPEAAKGEEGIPRIPGIGLVGWVVGGAAAESRPDDVDVEPLLVSTATVDVDVGTCFAGNELEH